MRIQRKTGATVGILAATGLVIGTIVARNNNVPAPVMQLAPSSLSFGSQDIAAGATGSQTITLTNTGNGSMTIASISLTGTDSSQFNIATNSCGSTLAAAGSCNLGVTFDPSTSGSKSAAVQVNDNAPGSPHQTTLAGTGTTTTIAAPTTLANFWVDQDGGTCTRNSTPAVYNDAAACSKSLLNGFSGVQPGDIIEFAPSASSYGSLSINRTPGVGSDSPKIRIIGDPTLVDQQRCIESEAMWLSATPLCPHGSVLHNGMAICAHGISIEDFDTTGLSATLNIGNAGGASPCPLGSQPNQIVANTNIDVINSHFTYQSVTRVSNANYLHDRFGPNEHICDPSHTNIDGDNLELWPDTTNSTGAVPVNITIDHSLFYDAQWGPTGTKTCGWQSHADLIQTLGYNNLTVTNTIFWMGADSDWQDGLVGSDTIGNAVFRNDYFGQGGQSGGSGSTQFGNADPNGPCTNGPYTFENNTFATTSTFSGPYCSGANGTASIIRNNFFNTNGSCTPASSPASTQAAWSFNVFRTGQTTCGTNIKTCVPTFWGTPTGNGTYPAPQSWFPNGWDASPAASDTCLKNAGDPTNFVANDFWGTTRLAGNSDAGAFEQPRNTPIPAANANGVTVGNGFVRDSSRQIVRTSSNAVYIFAVDDNVCQTSTGSAVLRAYKGSGAQGANANVPTSFAEVDAAHHPVSVGSGDCSANGSNPAAQMLEDPDVRLDSAGIAHLAYIDQNNGNVWYQTFNTNTDLWGTRTLVAANGSQISGASWPRTGQTALTLDSNRKPWIAWATSGSSNAIQFSNNLNGTWSSPANVATGTNIMHPSMTTSNRGVIQLAWLNNSLATQGSILYASNTAGVWSATETVSSGDANVLANGDDDQGPSIANDNAGLPYVLYMDGTVNGSNDFVRLRFRNSSGVWTDNTPPGGAGGASNSAGTMFAHTPGFYTGGHGDLYTFLGHDVNIQYGYQFAIGGPSFNWGAYTTLDPRSASSPAAGDTCEPGQDGAASVRFDPLNDNNLGLIDTAYYDERTNAAPCTQHLATIFYKAIQR